MKQFAAEHVLLQALQAGDTAAFQYLYKRNRGWLLTTVYDIVNDFPEAEEVVQDVFLQVYQSISGFGGRCTVSSWMYRIAVNKALNRLSHLKSRKRSAFILLGDAEPPERTESGAGEGHSSPEAISYGELCRLIGELPCRQRQAFLLCKVHQKSYKEAAEELACSVDSVAALMQRARLHLQEAVQRAIREKESSRLSRVA